MKKTQLLIATIIASGLIGTGIVKAAESTLSHGEKAFLEKAAKASTAEIELGKIGQQRGQTAQVKQFAQMVEQQHQQENQQLMQLAQKNGVDLKEATHHEAREMDYLRTVPESEFDHKYVDRIVKDHEKAIKEFEKEASKAKDPEVKAFAEQTLAKLRQHLQEAQQLAAASPKVTEPAGAQKNK